MRDYFLTTKRVGFSVWSRDDLPLAGSLWGQPEVTRFICASGVFTPQEIKSRLALEVDNYQKYGVQYFPFFQRSDGKLIGCCGLRPVPGQEDVFELGFHLKKEFWGQGLAFEAASAMIRHSFSTLHVRKLEAGHNPNNTASSKVLLKLGFQYKEDQFYPPTGLYHPSYTLENPL